LFAIVMDFLGGFPQSKTVAAEREHSLMRLSFPLCLAAALVLLDAQGSLRAEEIWPKQPPPSNQQEMRWPGFPPYAPAGTRFGLLGTGGCFFRERRFLDKYNEHPELHKQMALDGECIRFPHGHKVTALEYIRDWEGRVHDDQYGDGYLVMDSF
jgi:hypothetical protein